MKRRGAVLLLAAVDAARSGDTIDTIKVCPGLYEETVKVETKHLTIKGAKAGVDATEREGRRESVVIGDPEDDGDAEGVARGVVQLLADHITWDGFKIRDTIFLDNGLGLHLGASGEHPTVVCRNRFTANNEFTEDGAAVLFADQGVDDVLIEHNKSVDDLTFASSFNSTRVRVTANWIRARVGDTEFPGPASAIFIGAGKYQVLANRSRTNGVGIHLGLGTSGVVVDGNTALDNALDCQDQSTPLANTWQGNVGVSSHPPPPSAPHPPS